MSVTRTGRSASTTLPNVISRSSRSTGGTVGSLIDVGLLISETKLGGSVGDLSPRTTVGPKTGPAYPGSIDGVRRLNVEGARETPRSASNIETSRTGEGPSSKYDSRGGGSIVWLRRPLDAAPGTIASGDTVCLLGFPRFVALGFGATEYARTCPGPSCGTPLVPR